MVDKLNSNIRQHETKIDFDRQRKTEKLKFESTPVDFLTFLKATNGHFSDDKRNSRNTESCYNLKFNSFFCFIHSIIFFIFESIFILPISSNEPSMKEMLTIIQTTIFFLTASKFQTYFIKAFFYTFTIHNTLIYATHERPKILKKRLLSE